MIDGAVYNENGLVALRYFQPAPKLVSLGQNRYYFDCQHGLSLAFVPEADVPPLLSHLGGCCGGKKQIIFLASQVQYEHWKSGNGGR